MKTFWTFIAGIVIGGAVVGFYTSTRVGKEETPVTLEQVKDTTASTGAVVKDKLEAFKLGAEDIKDEMARTGRVIRNSMTKAGQAISNATEDARATTAIKGKLVADPELSALDISVNTTHGVVTLSGTVPTEADIGKAMLLALQTDGIEQVISTLQVKS